MRNRDNHSHRPKSPLPASVNANKCTYKGDLFWINKTLLHREAILKKIVFQFCPKQNSAAEAAATCFPLKLFIFSF